MKEACAINKSLSALGDVFKAIGENAKHVPYRNSKLTHLLSPCLGGDGKTLMLVNVAPESESAEESMHSLQFAAKVNAVELGGGEQKGEAERGDERPEQRGVERRGKRGEGKAAIRDAVAAGGAGATREHGGGEQATGGDGEPAAWSQELHSGQGQVRGATVRDGEGGDRKSRSRAPPGIKKVCFDSSGHVSRAAGCKGAHKYVVIRRITFF